MTEIYKEVMMEVEIEDLELDTSEIVEHLKDNCSTDDILEELDFNEVREYVENNGGVDKEALIQKLQDNYDLDSILDEFALSEVSEYVYNSLDLDQKVEQLVDDIELSTSKVLSVLEEEGKMMPVDIIAWLSKKDKLDDLKDAIKLVEESNKTVEERLVSARENLNNTVEEVAKQ